MYNSSAKVLQVRKGPAHPGIVLDMNKSEMKVPEMIQVSDLFVGGWKDAVLYC